MARRETKNYPLNFINELHKLKKIFFYFKVLVSAQLSPNGFNLFVQSLPLLVFPRYTWYIMAHFFQCAELTRSFGPIKLTLWLTTLLKKWGDAIAIASIVDVAPSWPFSQKNERSNETLFIVLSTLYVLFCLFVFLIKNFFRQLIYLIN